ncbi:hypothetical protein D3C87_1664900 [compost metagenome]
MLGLGGDAVDGLERNRVVLEKGQAVGVGGADIEDHLAHPFGLLGRRVTQIFGEILAQRLHVAHIVVDFQRLSRGLPILAEQGFGRVHHHNRGSGEHEDDRGDAGESGVEPPFDTGNQAHCEFSVTVPKFHGGG